MTTKTCSKCLFELPLDNFYKSESKCKPCKKEYDQAWAKANPEKYKQRWQKKNKEQWLKKKQDEDYLLKKAAYRKENSQKIKQNAKAWNQANRQKFNIHVSTSKIKRKLSKDAKAFRILDKEFRRIYASSCVFCGSNEKVGMNHNIPISRAGNHSIGNLQPVCRSCSTRKQNKLVSEYKYYLKTLDTNR